jgi:conjugative relaxase-like TrwC/TraI family protein
VLRTNVHVSATAAKGYYTEGLSRQDYYSEGQEITGSWGGIGAGKLGLSGQVDQSSFASLCENLHPGTGKQLTPRSRLDRRVGYDFNFHCPKSVSLLHALTGDPRIVQSFRAAVDETMRDIEGRMNTRVRRGGERGDRRTGNITWAEFIHFTSRPVEGVPDPHLHAHCFVFNATFDQQEQRWKAGEFAEIKNALEYHEAAFHLNLSNRLRAQGYSIERRGKNWEIAGISPEIISKFSRRSAQVEALAKARGITDAKLKDQLGAKTRQKKSKSLSISKLRAEWQGRISSGELAAIWNLWKNVMPPTARQEAAKEAVDYAIEHCFARKSVVPESKLSATAIRQAVGSGVDLSEIERELQGSALIRRKVAGRSFVTTSSVLAQEQWMISLAKEGKGREAPLKADTHRWTREFLGFEQKAAVQHVLKSKDRVILVRGGAGTGKTTLMREAVEAIETGGKKVFTFAPTAMASRKVLREEGFSGADTVARLLIDEKFQQQLKNQVVWIDEAGLLSVRDMLAVFKIAARENARVILSGDARQHSAVDRGDALRILETTGSVVSAEVNEIRRQRGDYKRAVEALSEGRTGQAFEILNRLGCVQEVSPDQIAEKASRDYLRAVKRGRSAVVISPTHREGEKVTDAIRERLKVSKLLSKRGLEVYQQVNLNWTDAQKTDAAAYQVGDVVQFVQNVKGFSRGERIVITGRDEAGNLTCSSLAGAPQKVAFPLETPNRFQVYRQSSLSLALGERIRVTQGGFTKNRCRLETGAVYTVKAFGTDGIECNNGFKIPWDYGHLAYGYVSTSHAAQGRTVDEVIIAQSSDSLVASSREQFYVSASRGRDRLTVYTDNREALLEAVGASGRRISASELLTENATKMSLFEKPGIKTEKTPSTDPATPKVDVTKPVTDQPPVKHEDKVFSGEAAKKETANVQPSADAGLGAKNEKVQAPVEWWDVKKAQMEHDERVAKERLGEAAKKETANVQPSTGTGLGATKEKVRVPVEWDVDKAQLEHNKRYAQERWGGLADKSSMNDPGWKTKESTPSMKGQAGQAKEVSAKADFQKDNSIPKPSAAPGAGAKQADFTEKVPSSVDKSWVQKEIERKPNTSDGDLEGLRRTLQADADREKAKVPSSVDRTWVQKEIERKPNTSDGDLKGLRRTLQADADREKALQAQKQKLGEVQKSHISTQNSQTKTANPGSRVVQGKWTAKIISEKPAAAPPPPPRPRGPKR